MIDQAVPGARKVSASELERLRGALREDAPESLVVLFAAKESDVEGSTGLMGSQSKLGGVFLGLAERQRESFSFAWSADPEAAAQAGVKPGTLAVLHSPLLAGGKLEPAVVAYSGAVDGEAAESWLWKASLPLVGELTSRTQPRYAHADATLVRVALPTDWRSDAKGANYLLNRLRRVAQLHPMLRFAAVKPDAQLAALAEHGVSDDAKAFSVTAVGAGGAKFAMEGSWSPTDSSTLEAWLQRLEGGLLEPFIKSEPVPSGLDNGVTVAVGKTFHATVLDETKDVLIEFYAPWCGRGRLADCALARSLARMRPRTHAPRPRCGHCKTLAPKYEELAQALAHVDTLTVAKMDATANEWSHKEVYEVKGFPTLYFKPAGKAAMAYDGAREPGAMAEWMAAQATHKFTVPPSLKAAGGAPKKKASKKATKKAEEAEL